MLMDQDTQWLYHVLAEVQLEKFYLRVRDGLNITRIEHFAYVKEADLEHIGISRPGEPDLAFGPVVSRLPSHRNILFTFRLFVQHRDACGTL